MKSLILCGITIFYLSFIQFGFNSVSWGDIIAKNLTSMDDVFVYRVDPDENYNDGSPSCPNCGIALKLIPPGGHEGEARILLKYWLADIPSNATITSARLRFLDLAGSINNSSDSVSFTVHEITSVWFESIATWNNQPLYDPAIIGSGTLIGTVFDVSVSIDPNLVNGWLDGTIPNNGIIVVPTGFVSSTSRKTMPSYEHDGSGVYLEVQYDDGNSPDNGGGGGGSGSSGGGGGGGCFISTAAGNKF